MKFQSNGKLLITGEYLVLKGAISLAVPLVFQQTLKINESVSPALEWTSFENGVPWFNLKLNPSLFEILNTADEQKADFLLQILKAATKLNPNFQNKLKGAAAVSDMDFKREWGFGSSSSLISNIAYWAEVNPFKLHKTVSKGSGYDVVTSRSDGPLYYCKKGSTYNIENIEFNPHFKENIYFVYLGQKQDTAKNVDVFLKRKKSFHAEVKLISQLTKHIAQSQTLEDFEYYIREHEYIIAAILKQESIKETVFKTLQGEAKSLGAWGGDFAMVTWQYGKDELIKNLKSKNLDVVFSFDELIKTW